MRELERAIGHSFGDGRLLVVALTHASLAGESDVMHNQRLEFLGDAVLQLLMSERLYRAYPNSMEGELSRTRARSVNENALCDAARRLGLGRFLRMSNGEEASGGRDRPSVLADAMEALLGAVYLDAGLEAARAVADALLPTVSQESARDYKSELQEITQRDSGFTPAYRIVAEKGPPHNRTFVAGVFGGEALLGEGSGSSKKAAEQEAARLAIEGLKRGK